MFIVIEGLDGAGKSTQVAKITNYFVEQGKEVEYLHFPRFDAPVYGDMIAKFLRGEYGDINSVHPQLVALIYAGDRAEASGLINGWLSAGKVVVIDRYVCSNIAYQCAKLAENGVDSSLCSDFKSSRTNEYVAVLKSDQASSEPHFEPISNTNKNEVDTSLCSDFKSSRTNEYVAVLKSDQASSEPHFEPISNTNKNEVDTSLCSDFKSSRTNEYAAVLKSDQASSKPHFEPISNTNKNEVGSTKQELKKWIWDTEFNHFKIPKPDLTIFLDVPFKFTTAKLQEERVGDDRDYLKGKKDIHEASLDFQSLVRQEYLKMAQEGLLKIVDCSDSNAQMATPSDIFKRIENEIKTITK